MNIQKICGVSFLLLLVVAVSCDLNSAEDAPNKDDDLATEIPEAPFLCEDGFANGFPCQNVNLYAQVTISELSRQASGIGVNDIWGWTDPVTNKEYALVGLTNGVSFVDISEPENPILVGFLPEIYTKTSSKSSIKTSRHDEEGKGESAWRDIKTYSNHAFIVSDNQPHGLQVFDLNKLRNIDSPPVAFEEDAHYDQFGPAHNIAINEQTGFAYVVGSDTYGGGLHIIDINNPTDPVFAGFHSDSTAGIHKTGYVHDTQCVIYNGNDAEYKSKEICFNSSETALVIADVTNKNETKTISITDYAGRDYAHQGWLTEDHQYFLMDDELDSGNTTTYIWNLNDLDNPQMIGTYEGNSLSIDHNQYIKGNYVYQSNYTSGLQILSLTNIENAHLSQVGYFDTFPENNNRGFNGSWSNYPFFESGLVIISDMNNGLFIVKPELE